MPRVALLLLIPVLTVVAGCATAAPGPVSDASPVASWSTASSEPFGVVDARLSGTTLTVTVSAPAGGPLCSRNPRAAVSDQDERTVWVQVLIDSDPSCAGTQQLEVTTTVPALAGRQLVVDSTSAFHVDAGGVLAACDADFGCSGPPDDHCDRAWVDVATQQGELPPEVSTHVLGCTQEWLVMDVDAVVTGCQPVDGAPPPTGCAGSGRHVRWFLRFDTRWTVVASSSLPGCAGVHATVPEFPDALCAALPVR